MLGMLSSSQPLDVMTQPPVSQRCREHRDGRIGDMYCTSKIRLRAYGVDMECRG